MSTTSINQRIHPHKTGIFTRVKPAADDDATAVAQTDARSRRILPPVRVLWQSADGARRTERLLAAAAYGLPNDPSPCILTAAGGVLLDFGQEVNGGIQILSGGSAPSRCVPLRLRFGESAGEAMGEPDRSHPCRDVTIDVPWHGNVEMGHTGFRFLRLDAPAADTPLALSGVRAIAIERAETRQGSFRCNDACINAVWDLSTRTADLCLQELLLAGLKCARFPCTDDLHPAILTIADLYGDHATIRATLDLLRERAAPGAWLDHRPAASMWWVIAAGSWYLRTGNRAWLAEQRAHLLALVELLDTLVGPDGSLRHNVGVSDPSLDGDEALAGACLAAKALRTITGLCQALDEMTASHRAASAEQRLGRRPLPAARTCGGTALAVIAGRRDPVEANRSVLSLAPDPHFSAFVASFILRARTQAADTRGALDLLRRYWGGMLDLGATTCWDQFDQEWAAAPRLDELPADDAPHPLRDAGGPAWNMDLCSARATGPAPWLLEQVVGLTAVEPGYHSLRLTPSLGDLSWVEASVPTPRGLITVRHERRHDGNLHTAATLPHGITRVE